MPILRGLRPEATTTALERISPSSSAMTFTGPSMVSFITLANVFTSRSKRSTWSFILVTRSAPEMPSGKPG